MSDKKIKIWVLGALVLLISGCYLLETKDQEIENMRLKMPSSVVVCRSKECAPAKLSMSTEYIFNSLSHLLTNNNRQKALICEANPANHACTENYITLPIRVGITPAYMYIDAVKITDVTIAKGTPKINLVLNYNVTYNGQTPECTSSKSLMYVKNSDNIIMEDGGYSCKMTTMGLTSIRTLFMVDYIDLDYGYIGGFYSIGLSGPASGGGTGYMLFRLPKDTTALSPALTVLNPETNKTRIQSISQQSTLDSGSVSEVDAMSTSGVQIFPVKK